MQPTLHSYRLPLIAPLAMKAVTHTRREGVLLRLEDDLGNVGWGDCAPLPGFSKETLDEAIAQLHDVVSWLQRHPADSSWADLDHPVHGEIDAMDLFPSVRYGLELALFDLIAGREGRPLPALLHPDPGVTIPLNALLIGEGDEQMLDRAQRLVDQGYETLKLKVGRRSLDVDIARVRALRLRVGPDVAIRLDANRAWTLAEGIDFAEGVYGLDLAYVEEPLKDPRDLPLLWFDGGLPIALDESLTELQPEDLAGQGWACATAAVLKPTLLGGIIPTLRMAWHASEVGIQPVISGAFESGIGMRGNVALAAATGGAPAGLDPYNLLASDVLTTRLPLDRPLVDVPGLFGRGIVVQTA